MHAHENPRVPTLARLRCPGGNAALEYSERCSMTRFIAVFPHDCRRLRSQIWERWKCPFSDEGTRNLFGVQFRVKAPFFDRHLPCASHPNLVFERHLLNASNPNFFLNGATISAPLKIFWGSAHLETVCRKKTGGSALRSQEFEKSLGNKASPGGSLRWAVHRNTIFTCLKRV